MKFLGEIENTHDVVNKSYVESLIEGTATDIASQLISEALQDNATQTWVNQQGFLTEHQDLSGYQTKITSSNKLAYSLISGTPDLSVYLTASLASSTYQPKITSSAKLAASLVSGLATVATSGSYNDLSNKPTIPSNTNQLTNGAGFITSSALSSYLPLSGGTLTGTLKVTNIESPDGNGLLSYQPSGWTGVNNTQWGIGTIANQGVIRSNNTSLLHYRNGSDVYTIWDSGNSNLSSVDWNASKLILNTTNTTDWNVARANNTIQLLRTGGTAGNAPLTYSSGISIMTSYTGFQLASYGGDWNNLYFRSIQDNDTWLPWRTVAFTDSNVASATKLQTARKIWGQSFDGTGNVNGIMYLQTGSAISYYDENAKANREFIRPPSGVSGGLNLIIGRYNADYDYILSLCGKSMVMYTGSWGSASMFIDNLGNVGIGTTSPAYKLDVNGNGRFNKYLVIGASLGQSNTARAQLDLVSADTNPCDLYLGADSTRYWSITSRNNADTTFGSKGLGFWDAVNSTYRMCITQSGNVGIGTTSPSTKLTVKHTDNTIGIRLDGGWSGYGYRYTAYALAIDGVDKANFGYNTVTSSHNTTAQCGTYIFNIVSNEWMNFNNEGGVYLHANFLVKGGITQYSDIRKKTKLNDVELSLSQVANAPLIEHYYNSDDKKTTHVGSIAQYWAEMNDWFCKLDSDGFYTMEIQNAALASAISVARELERYESKTDKKIRLLKKRINELEDEIEKLKSA